MNVKEMIEEVKHLLEEEISVTVDNDLFATYKSRNVSNYAQALKALTDIERRN